MIPFQFMARAGYLRRLTVKSPNQRTTPDSGYPGRHGDLPLLKTNPDLTGLPMSVHFVAGTASRSRGLAMPCPYSKSYSKSLFEKLFEKLVRKACRKASNWHLECDILSSQTRWQSIGHPPESSRLAERLHAPAELLRPHSTAPPPGAWLR